MREYGQIQCSFWTDPDIQRLSDGAARLAAYLLTGPHSNGIGCYRLPDGYVIADFGWALETVSERFAELFEIGFCKRCERTDYVFMPKFLRWNQIANGNVASAREKEFCVVPQKFSFYQELAEVLIKYGRHFKEPFANRLETVSKQYPTQPIPNQEKEAAAAREEISPPPSGLMSAVGAAGWPFNKIQDAKVIPMVRQWERDGVTPQHVADAVEIAKSRCGGKLPGSPTYLDGIVSDLMAAKQRTGGHHAPSIRSHKPSLAERATAARIEAQRLAGGGPAVEPVGADDTHVRAPLDGDFRRVGDE